MKQEHNYSLLKHNTFGIDARATMYIEYTTEDELRSVLSSLTGRRVLHIGQGSNLLFTHDFDGVVLHSGIQGIHVTGEQTDSVEVRVGAGTPFDELVVWAITHDLSGLENLSLIPGEAGAAAVQNIGAYGVEAKDSIIRVEAVNLSDGTPRTLTNTDCRFGYRQSIFKQELRGQFAVTYVTFRLQKAFTPHLDYGNIRASLPADQPLTPQLLRDTIIRLRQAKLPDPQVIGSAGSFFMNPVIPRARYEALRTTNPNMPHYDLPSGEVKIPAGWLIEQCGWRGRSIGHAGVYSRQALVLVNLGGATGTEVLHLSQAICQSVADKFGITIRPEVNII